MLLPPARGRGWVGGSGTSSPPPLASPPSGGEEHEKTRKWLFRRRFLPRPLLALVDRLAERRHHHGLGRAALGDRPGGVAAEAELAVVHDQGPGDAQVDR